MKPRGNPPVLKRFGQHFLTDSATLDTIAAAVDPHPGDSIIEIGPGRGVLTDLLARYDNDLFAIEVDHLLSEQLRKRYSDNARVHIVEQDVLKVDLTTLVQGDFVVVGNVPYYITTPILFHVLRRPLPRHAVFLVQREVAERVTATAGTSEYGALSVNVQAIATPQIVRHVPPSAFRPPPKVDSAVIKVVPRADPLVHSGEIESFRRFVQATFGMRRKQVANVLRSVTSMSAEQVAEILSALKIDPRARPETFTPAEFVSLFRAGAHIRSD